VKGKRNGKGGCSYGRSEGRGIDEYSNEPTTEAGKGERCLPERTFGRNPKKMEDCDISSTSWPQKGTS